MTVTVQIGDLCLGTGLPAVCVPVQGRDEGEVLRSFEQAVATQPDIIEWRIDGCTAELFPAVCEHMMTNAFALRDSVPVLATVRSTAEGGAFDGDETHYCQQIEAIIESGIASLIDIEQQWGPTACTRLLEKAGAQNLPSIGSRHYCTATPSAASIVDDLVRMQEMGFSVGKIATMPATPGDVVTLLDATATAREHLDIPIATMAMGPLGVVTRLVGEVFGSCLTFAKAGQASAPGQIPVDEVRSVLSIVHTNLVASQHGETETER